MITLEQNSIKENIEPQKLEIKTKKKALEIIGGSLSEPSKMPGYGWGISAKRCARGSMLARQEGTVCSKCYALKGHYTFKNVYEAHERRLDQMNNNSQWVEAMTYLLKDEKEFRWLDSGDLQSVGFLSKIVEVCNATPNVKHWLPTREVRIVIMFLDKGGVIPDNLNIRISADKINELPMALIKGFTFSTTSTKDNWEGAHNCPVSFVKDLKSCEQAGCRACWNKNVTHINYKVH